MKPDDILNAIGEVDDAYIKKAHQKSFFKALLVFVIIMVIGFTISALQYPDYHLLLRYNPDGSVNTGYIEPEAITQTNWTSMEYTAYLDGEIVSVTEFRHTIYPGYAVNHTENGKTTTIVGSNGESLWPNDYLENIHYSNQYITTLFSTDLLDRIDKMFVNSQVAYGTLNQQLNYVVLEYLERGDMVQRQTLYTNGRTSEAEIVSSRGYSYQNKQITGWSEWDPEWNLLAYAEYTYDGNIQTVSTYLADGTLAETRVSKYSYGYLKYREHYDPDGKLIGREVYRYRFWELFYSVEALLILAVTLTLALIMAFAVWEDRLLPGTRLLQKVIPSSQDDTLNLIQEVQELKVRIAKLSSKLPDTSTEEIVRMTEELKRLNDHLEEILGNRTDNE